MTAAQLIVALAKLPPETVVVKFNKGPEGYDEVWFMDGTHTGHDGEGDYLKINRAKRVKGEDRPDYLIRDGAKKSAAQRIPYVVMY